MTQLISLFQAGIMFGTVILFGATGETLTEKSGNLNLGVPGIMYLGGIMGLMGVFFYEMHAAEPNKVLCVLIAMACAFTAAMLGGLIYSVLTITLRANQNVTGLTLTIFAGGFANFFGGSLNKLAGGVGQISVSTTSAAFRASLPFAQDLHPVLSMLFGYGFMVYLAVGLALVVNWFINRTSVGLNLRAVGENPGTADAAGIRVTAYKYLATCIGAGISGLGGLFYVMDYTKGTWDSDGGIDIDSVKIVVTNENRAPRLVSWEPASESFKIPPLASQTFYIQVEDPDNDPIYYTWRLNGQVVGSSSSYTFDSRYYPLGNNYMIMVEYGDATHTATLVWSIVTAVELKSFTCASVAYQGITLSWQTASETDNMGFNVLRSRTEKGTYEKINPDLISPRMDGQYNWVDKSAKAGERWYYKLEDISRSGLATQHGPVSADMPVPTRFELAQNYPNPFNPVTNIRYQLPADGKVTLQIFNTNGQLIRTLVDGEVPAGYHQIVWDSCNDSGSRVVSGIYYYRIIANGTSVTKKMALLK